MTALDGHRQGHIHTVYDLTVLRAALELLLDNPRISQLAAFEQLDRHPTKLLDDITHVL